MIQRQAITVRRTPDRFRLAMTLLALAALGACSALELPGAMPSRPTESRAAGYAEAGEYAAAADMYEGLARVAAPADAERLRLKAALQWLAAGDTTRAETNFASVVEPDTRSPLAVDWHLVHAGLQLAEGEAAAAIATLDAISTRELSLHQRLTYASRRASALFAEGKPADGTSYLTRRELWLESERDIIENHQAIWDGLRSVDNEALAEAIAVTRDPVVRGWLELVHSTNPVRSNPAMMNRVVAGWARSHAGHPANAFFVPALLGSEPESRGAIESVALMLPLDGRERSAATAIRDGFVTAHLNDAPAFNAPEVRVYNTSTDGAIVTYNRAVEDGADIVVGPLTRTAVRELALAGTLPVPALALNRLPREDFAPSGMYQFALAPEDEASEVARRALASGHARAVALVPIGGWGERVLASFSESLNANGGYLLDYETYDPAETDYSAAIERVMQIRSSVQRRNRVRQLVGTALQYEPRRRADVDFIFIAASPARCPSAETPAALPLLRRPAGLCDDERLRR